MLVAYHIFNLYVVGIMMNVTIIIIDNYIINEKTTTIGNVRAPFVAASHPSPPLSHALSLNNIPPHNIHV